MSFARRRTRWLLFVVMAWCAVLPVLQPISVLAQEEPGRKVKSKVEPAYPELARRMNLAGTVKLQVVVAPNGTAKTIKPVGGNPVLIEAAADALKKWKWEPGDETTEVIAIHFVR